MYVCVWYIPQNAGSVPGMRERKGNTESWTGSDAGDAKPATGSSCSGGADGV